jgi:ACS family glucarate transporter-like MFS transporter
MPGIFKVRLRWVVIFWMFVISAIAYLDRVNISIAGQSIQKELNLTNTQLGWVFSAFVLGYALMQAPGGRLADRFGPRRVIAVGTLWWGAFTALTAIVSPKLSAVLLILLLVRFTLGVGEAVVYPAGNRLVATWIPSGERGIANGLIFAGVGVGAGIAPPFITYILLHHGWRWSFWMCAVMSLAAGAVWIMVCRDKPADHPWIDSQEVSFINAGLTQRGTETRVPWRMILGSKDVLALTLSYFCYGYVAYIYFTWFFIYLNRVRGLDLKSSSYYGMLPFLMMATCSPLGGWVSDFLTKHLGKRVGRSGVALVGMGLSGLFVAFGAQVADARLASIVLAGGAGALYFSLSVFWSVTADMGGRSAGSVSGVMNMGNQIGGTITGSLTPFLASQFGWTASFLVAAGLCGVGALTWLVVDPERKLELELASARQAAK